MSMRHRGMRSFMVWLLSASAASAQESGQPPPEPGPSAEEPAVPAKADDPTTQPEGTKASKKDKKRAERVRVSGFIQFFFKQRFDTNDDGAVEPSLFRMHRVRVRVEGHVFPWLSYQVEIDPRSPTIFGVLRDAYFELHVIPRHRIRVGQQKTQFGYENRESSSRLYTVTRSELSEGPARGVTLRDIGLGLIGHWPLGGGFTVEDAITLVNGAGMNVQADDTATKNVWGRVGLRYRHEALGLDARLGVSGAIGDQTEPEDPGPPVIPAYVLEFRRVGVDLEVDSRWVFVAAELGFSRDEAPDFPEASGDQLGYYVLVAGKTPWNVGPVLRYDTLDTEGFTRWTLGAYVGRPDARLRAIASYEIFEDDAGPHDHRLTLWSQVRF